MTTEKVIEQLNVEISTELLEVLKESIEEKLQELHKENLGDFIDKAYQEGEINTYRTVMSMIDALVEAANENKD